MKLIGIVALLSLGTSVFVGSEISSEISSSEISSLSSTEVGTSSLMSSSDSIELVSSSSTESGIISSSSSSDFIESSSSSSDFFESSSSSWTESDSISSISSSDFIESSSSSWTESETELETESETESETASETDVDGPLVDMEQVYTEEVEYDVDVEEIVGLADAPDQTVNDFEQGVYIIQFEKDQQSQSDLWENLEVEGFQYNIDDIDTASEEFDFVTLSVSNENENNSTNLTVSNLIEAADGTVGVSRNEFISSYFSLVPLSEPSWDPHVVTGVKALHENGIRGNGVVIGIIDSGIDATHEVFAGRTIDGWNFVDPNNPTKDITDADGHGTFVASIIGANSKSMVGVAPDATIRMYRTADVPDGTHPYATILRAATQAKKDGVDVLSISLGSPMSSYKNSYYGLKLAEIARHIPVVVSSGNNGHLGLFQSERFGSQSSVISVGAVEASSVIMWPMTIISGVDELSVEYVRLTAFNAIGTFNAEYVDDLCRYPGGSPGKVFLLGYARTCDSAKLYSLYPNVVGFVSFSSIPSYSESSRYGETKTSVRDWLVSKGGTSGTFQVKVNIDTAKPVMSSRKDSWAGKMSDFSTWGPTYSADFYPSISGPGGNVLGAGFNNRYKVSSGTSFSAPYLAGVIALYLSQNPNATPDQVRKRLLSTANLMPHFKDGKVNTKWREPVVHQGAGMVDAWKFLYANHELISDPLLSWGDTSPGHRKSDGILQWKNTGTKTRTYRVYYGNARSVLAKSTSRGPAIFYPPTSDQTAAVTVSHNRKITLKPGQVGKYRYWLTAPANTAKDRALTWQGYFKIKDDLGESITVPYMGIETSVVSWLPFHEKPTMSPSTFSIAKNKWPTFTYTLDYGSEYHSFDLVQTDFHWAQYKKGKWGPVHGLIGPLKGKLTSSPEGEEITEDFSFPYYETIFGKFKFEVSGLTSGREIGPGQYRILMRAQKPLQGDKYSWNWDYYLTDIISYRQGLGLIDENENPPSSSTSTSSSTTSDISTESPSTETSSSIDQISSSTPPDSVSPSPVSPSPVSPSPVSPSPESPTPNTPTPNTPTPNTPTPNTPTPNTPLTKSCTSGCNEPKGTVTITRCSDGGCEQLPVTIGETKTVVVTATTCTNNVCSPQVTSIVEVVDTTIIDGKVEIYTSSSTIAAPKAEILTSSSTFDSSTIDVVSASTLFNSASKAASSILMLLLSLLVI